MSTTINCTQHKHLTIEQVRATNRLGVVATTHQETCRPTRPPILQRAHPFNIHQIDSPPVRSSVCSRESLKY